MLVSGLKNASSNNIWGAVLLQMLAKVTLCLPSRGGKHLCLRSQSFVDQLRQWQSEGPAILWKDVMEGRYGDSYQEGKSSGWCCNQCRCRQYIEPQFRAHEGHYSKVIRGHCLVCHELLAQTMEMESAVTLA